MYDFHRFEDVFEDLDHTYSDKQIKSIESNRRLLQGTLFIDRVLKLLDIKRGKPPSNHNNSKHGTRGLTLNQ